MAQGRMPRSRGRGGSRKVLGCSDLVAVGSSSCLSRSRYSRALLMYIAFRCVWIGSSDRKTGRNKRNKRKYLYGCGASRGEVSPSRSELSYASLNVQVSGRPSELRFAARPATTRGCTFGKTLGRHLRFSPRDFRLPAKVLPLGGVISRGVKTVPANGLSGVLRVIV